MLRATKVRIYPTPEQAEFLAAQFGVVHFAYNKALHSKAHTYRLHGISAIGKYHASILVDDRLEAPQPIHSVEKVVNARSEFQHKCSRTLVSKKRVDENQAVIIETLKSANMMKNRTLAKHIADASWHNFVVKLQYKAKE